ncbi:DUF6427 family protein [Patiriisocius sp. Uisw_017]|jgi:hypothetical protein|uniref:DUF6427 family protein n=1 Tax=Patiriisocius sp. Uisw_017 TaxID=3230968 RepID=UPI0039E7A153
MLTSFFGKSSPINYLLLSALVTIGFFVNTFSEQAPPFSVETLPQIIGVLLLSIFAMLLLDFIIRKNNVTLNNTYAVFIFTVFTFLAPQFYQSPLVLLSNVFLLLATRRILSLNNEKNIEKKIFDAAIYITLASMCYFWSILFFLILFIAIVRKTSVIFRHFIIPFIGIITVFVVATTFQFLINDSFNWFYEWLEPIDFSLHSYNDIKLLIPAFLFVCLAIWMGLYRFGKLKMLSKKEKPSAGTMLFIVIITLCITLASPQKNGAELIFLFAPIAMITTNYVEISPSKERSVFNEILLWCIVLIALTIHFL